MRSLVAEARRRFDGYRNDWNRKQPVADIDGNELVNRLCDKVDTLTDLLLEILDEDMLRDCNPQDPNLEWPHWEGERCPDGHPNMCGACHIRGRIEEAVHGERHVRQTS